MPTPSTSPTAPGADAPPTAGPLGFAGARFYHLTLSAADQLALAAWYQRVLGFGLHSRAHDPSSGSTATFLDFPGLTLEILQMPGSVPVRRAAPPRHVLTQGWGNFSMQVPDLAAALAHLARLGVMPASPPTAFPDGTQAAFLLDPEGNAIELVQRPAPVVPPTYPVQL